MRDRLERDEQTETKPESVPSLPLAALEAAPEAIATPAPQPEPASRFRSFLFPCALALVILLALGMQAWVYAGHVYWISSDESGRTQQAWNWAVNPQPGLLRSLVDTWPPLPKILTGMAIKYVYADVFMTPRLLTTLFSILAMAALLLLAHELFASRVVTVAAGVLAALYSHRVILSVVPLAEIQYMAWVLLGLFCALRGLGRGRPAWNLAAALAFALAMMVRYEAWLFGGAYLLVLGWRVVLGRPRLKPWIFALGALLILAFPACWIWLFAHFTSKPLGFIENTAGQYQGRFGTNVWRNFQLSAPYLLFRTNASQLNLLGLIGAALWGWRARERRGWLLIPAAALLGLGVLGTLGKAMPTHNFWRISSAWGMLLVPFTAACCVEVVPGGSRLARRLGAWRSALPLALFVLLAGLFVRDTRYLRTCFEALPETVQTGAALRAAMAAPPAGEKPFRIMIEQTPDYAYLNIEAAAGNFGRFVFNTEFGVPPRYDPARSRYYRRLLTISGIRFLVLRSPELKAHAASYVGARLVSASGSYSVFELR